MPSDISRSFSAAPPAGPSAGQALTQVRPQAPASATVKRACDLVLASVGIVVLAPLMALIAALVAIDGGHVLYSHPRIGRDGRTFGCLKFRTMILGAMDCLEEYLAYHPQEREEWESSRKLIFDPRTTAIGRLLRRTSLDELPQLFNVLRGDMSIVGPRPVTASELALYGAEARLYTSVRPGITGPWQISGRNDLSYAERVALDAAYVTSRSLVGDFIIILRTPRAVLSRSGAR